MDPECHNMNQGRGSELRTADCELMTDYCKLTASGPKRTMSQFLRKTPPQVPDDWLIMKEVDMFTYTFNTSENAESCPGFRQ